MLLHPPLHFPVVENRAVMRELEGVDKLIRFIGRPEYSDLHVFAVMVLSNCLEDTETMEVPTTVHLPNLPLRHDLHDCFLIQLVKETGGLQRLVAFITDTQPPEEEDKGKGKKAEKGGASRAGKKGKGGEDGMLHSLCTA